MNISEIVGIMKFEARLANRTQAEGLANWTPEARVASLATRRAKGSVWGWDKRKRAAPVSDTSEGFDASLEAMTEDAEGIRRTLASENAGIPSISARSKASDEYGKKSLEAFKAWLSEVKRVEGAIDQFNGTVAALGGLQSGAALAAKGKMIGGVNGAVVPKVAVEKAIRRNYEKRNADHLSRYPEERGTMMDMVAEKAEYYSAQPARKIEMEKTMYRQIRDEGMMMRESPAKKGGDTINLLQAKRAIVQESEAVRSQLKAGETARRDADGTWIAKDAFGNERVISGNGDYREIKGVPFVLRLKKPTSLDKQAPVFNNDLYDAIMDARGMSSIGGGHIDRIANRWSAAARAAALIVRRANAAARKAAKASTVVAPRDPNEKYKGADGAVMSDEERRRYKLQQSFEKQYEKDILDPELGGYKNEDIQDAIEMYTEKGAAGMDDQYKDILLKQIKAGDPVEMQAIKKEVEKTMKAKPSSPVVSAEGTDNWDKQVSGFKDMIAKGSKPTSKNLQSQLLKDHDQKKYTEAKEALGEAWHTHSLDKFQDKFSREPRNNKEFRAFQKSIGVPVEYIGAK